MELVLICIALFLGKSAQELNSEDINNILDELIRQIKNNDTIDANNESKDDTILDKLNNRSSDQSKVIYLRTYNKPIIDFIPDNISDVTDGSQEYSKSSVHFSEPNESQSVVKTYQNDNENILNEIVDEIKSLNENTPDKKDQMVRSPDESKIILIKGYNNPIIDTVQINTSDFAIPLEIQNAQQIFDNFSLPHDLLNIIKENHEKGIILKEVVVKIERNSENNLVTNITNQTQSSKPKLTENSESVITVFTDRTLSNISTVRSKTAINKMSNKKLNHKKHVSTVIKNNDTNNTRKETLRDSYLKDRTVSPELRQYEDRLLNSNIPQFSGLNILPRLNRIEKPESRPFLWRNRILKPPSCEENCMSRKLLPYYVYPTPLVSSPYVTNGFLNGPYFKPTPRIVTPRFTKLQIDRALQDTYSISRSQKVAPTYYTTDFMNRIRSRMIYQPLYNNIVYL